MTATRWGSRGYGSRWGRQLGVSELGRCDHRRRTTWWFHRRPSVGSRTQAYRRLHTCLSPRRGRWTRRWRTVDSSAERGRSCRSTVVVPTDVCPSGRRSVTAQVPPSWRGLRSLRDHTASSSVSTERDSTRRPPEPEFDDRWKRRSNSATVYNTTVLHSAVLWVKFMSTLRSLLTSNSYRREYFHAPIKS